MKPMMIIPPETFSAADIDLLNKNGLCVVVAKDPSLVKFVDPLPAASSRTQIENAAIKLSRTLLSRAWGWHSANAALYQSDFATMFVKLLTDGTEMDDAFARAKASAYQQAFLEEQRKMAREDARNQKKAKEAK